MTPMGLSCAFTPRPLACLLSGGSRESCFMHPNKTDQARLALQSPAGPLSLRERRALTLCNGRRDLKELTAPPGVDAPAPVSYTHLHVYKRRPL